MTIMRRLGTQINVMPSDRAALNRLARKGFLGIDEAGYYHIRKEILDV